MTRLFQCVDEFGGNFIPLQQLVMKQHYEEITKKPFLGVCAGMVAAVSEIAIRAFSHVATRPGSMFRQISLSTNIPEILVSRIIDKSINYQEAYESDSKNFLTRFTREMLRISKTGYSDDEYYCCPLDLIEAIDTNNPNHNQVLFINMIYEFVIPTRSVIEDHMMLLMKHNSRYICCEPNSGIAIFNDGASFKRWLSAEMEKGALMHFKQSVPTRMLIPSRDKKTAELHEGFLKAKSVRVQPYNYQAVQDTSRIQVMPDPLRKKARL